MPSSKLDRPVRLSLLDRLTFDRDAKSAGTADDLSIIIETVRRDLESLLNTRRVALYFDDGLKKYTLPPRDFPEVQQSLYQYGLPDITSFGRDSPETRAALVSQLEETIALFEPRLSHVRIVPAKESMDGFRRLRFVIHAMLAADPAPVRITFDTAVDRRNGDVDLQPAGE